MKQFRSGVNPNNEFVFHFTTMKGGKGITGSKSGGGGKEYIQVQHHHGHLNIFHGADGD